MFINKQQVVSQNDFKSYCEIKSNEQTSFDKGLFTTGKYTTCKWHSLYYIKSNQGVNGMISKGKNTQYNKMQTILY